MADTNIPAISSVTILDDEKQSPPAVAATARLTRPADVLAIPFSPASLGTSAADRQIEDIADAVRGVRDWPSNGPPDDAELVALRDHAAARLAAFDRALEPAPREVIIMLLAVLRAAFPPRAMSPETGQIAADVYMQMLTGWPADLLAEAGREAIRTRKFFPTIAELLEPVEYELEMRRAGRSVLALRVAALASLDRGAWSRALELEASRAEGVLRRLRREPSDQPTHLKALP